jgi:hypothetical protein
MRSGGWRGRKRGEATQRWRRTGEQEEKKLRSGVGGGWRLGGSWSSDLRIGDGIGARVLGCVRRGV